MRIVFALLLALAGPAGAQTCGGNLLNFIADARNEALARDLPPDAIDRFFEGAAIDPKVLTADRSQSVFQRDFVEFSRRLISQNRIDNAQVNSRRYDAIFTRIEQEYGIPRAVLLAFWAFETDFGAIQGDFNSRNALVTLSHDCRRPDLFRPQMFAAIELTAQGAFDPASTTGAWAGEIGQVQMLPEDIIRYGRDGDGDGRISLKTSAPDALLSGANVLSGLGWVANQPWIQEITVPSSLNWFETGLDHPKPVRDWINLGVKAKRGQLDQSLVGRVILPMGRDGPAFIAYPNFEVYFEWNQSFVYVLTAAYFATRIDGAQIYDAGNPPPGLSSAMIRILQEKLAARGHDVGGVDGILGAKTRVAIQLEQARLGLPADAWPTSELVNSL